MKIQGYRDANCLFMEMLVNRDTASSSSNFVDHEPVKNDYCLCLAIHAPKKGIVEVLFTFVRLFFYLLIVLECQLSWLGLPNFQKSESDQKILMICTT